jgi:4-hydroxybenzoate polyprenyltransferase
MPDRRPNRATALVLSTHPGPALAVTAIAVILGIGVGLEPWRVAVLGFAFLANQASVGLSNDWLDAERDRSVGRTDKPVARGDVSPTAARNAAFVTAALAIALTIPLGWPATLAHAVFLASAWAYNLGAKGTAFSVVPYIVSFGILPLIVTLARDEPALASPWALAAGALLGVAAHFANVLPDLEDDAATGIRGLPHRLGPRAVGLTIAGALAAASLALVLGLGVAATPPWIAAIQYTGLAVSLALAVAIAVLLLSGRSSRGRSARWMFRLIILGALIDVALLALSGQRLLA